jgi:hypothetical protein
MTRKVPGYNGWFPVQPFLSFYGGKFNMAQRLQGPRHDHVIEPFAGGAGYSCYWLPKHVTLIERDEAVAGVWKYLTKVKEAEFLQLPIVTDVGELPDSICQEAAWLIGFRMNRGIQVPGKTLCNWGRLAKAGIKSHSTEFVGQPTENQIHEYNKSARNKGGDEQFWSAALRDKLASQLKLIRHWKIIEGEWYDAPDIEAHWHIDPPYNNQAGRAYKHSEVDFDALAAWCKTRRGYVQVCENNGAEWLPFTKIGVTKGTAGRKRKGWSAEALFELGAPGKGQGFHLPHMKPIETIGDTQHVNRDGILRAAGNQARQGPAKVLAAGAGQKRSSVQKGRRALAAAVQRSPELVQQRRRGRGKG